MNYEEFKTIRKKIDNLEYRIQRYKSGLTEWGLMLVEERKCSNLIMSGYSIADSGIGEAILQLTIDCIKRKINRLQAEVSDLLKGDN